MHLAFSSWQISRESWVAKAEFISGLEVVEARSASFSRHTCKTDSTDFLKFYTYIHLCCMCACMRVCVHKRERGRCTWGGKCVYLCFGTWRPHEARCRGQKTACRCQSSPSIAWGSNSGGQTWQLVPLPPEPAHRPSTNSSILICTSTFPENSLYNLMCILYFILQVF